METISSSGSGKLPRPIRLRRGTSDDEFATFDVMRKAMGYDMLWTHHAAMRHHLRTGVGSSFWIAEETVRFGSPRIVGYAASIVRDQVWSLTEFFVLPASQRQGIGGALLDALLTDVSVARLEIASRIVLASHSFGADALYVRKLQTVPRLPMLLLAGSLADLRLPTGAPPVVEAASPLSPPQATNRAASSSVTLPPETLWAEPLVLTPETQEEIAALDRRILGYARPSDHAHWAGAMPEASRLFRRFDPQAMSKAASMPLVGYAYLGANSSGPALATEPDLVPALLAHVARRFCAAHAELGHTPFSPLLDVYWSLAGTNEAVLRWLLACKWRIAFHYLLMSTQPPGLLDRYIGYNPLYLL